MTEKLYIRKKTQMIIKDNIMRGVRTLESRTGSRGRWNLTGESQGIYDFATEEERDAKIADLVAKGCVLK